MNNLKRMIRGKQLGRLHAQYQKTSLECEHNLERTRSILEDVNDGYLPEDLVLTASPDSV